jgi:hypothetical protein
MRAASFAIIVLLAALLPSLGFGQQQEKLKIYPIKPELEIRPIESETCSELKSRLAATAAEDKSLCSGTAYTQRPKACIAIAQKLISVAQAQLKKLSSCPDLDANYAGAIIAYSSKNLQLFESYVADQDRRATPPSRGRSNNTSTGRSAPRRCWVVSQQCQDCNVNGCFPYVCNSRTECD